MPKILNANVMVEAMVMLRLLRAEWIDAVILDRTASTTRLGSSPIVLLQATTATVLDWMEDVSWFNIAWMVA